MTKMYLGFMFLVCCVSLCNASHQEQMPEYCVEKNPVLYNINKFSQFASLTMQWISTIETIEPNPVVDRLYSRKEIAVSQRDANFELAKKCSPFDKQVEPHCLSLAGQPNPHHFMMKYIYLTAFLNKEYIQRLMDSYTTKNL